MKTTQSATTALYCNTEHSTVNCTLVLHSEAMKRTQYGTLPSPPAPPSGPQDLETAAAEPLLVGGAKKALAGFLWSLLAGLAFTAS